MAASPCIQCRVNPQTKADLRTLAVRRGTTESALLKRMVELMLHSASEAAVPTAAIDGPDLRDARVTIRLAADDQRLLRARASGRGMPAATYISVLVRSHLRGLARLPVTERLALKESVAELAAIGRNLNQIARASNQGVRVAGPTHAELRAILKVCEILRDHVRGVLKANAVSWQVGHDEKPN